MVKKPSCFEELSSLVNSWEVTEQIMKDSKPQTNKAPAGTKQGGLSAEIQSRIGHQLRAMYDDVVRQGVPDRFAELIRKLDTVDAPPQAVAGELAAKSDRRD
jgi:hypothetical protein